MSELSYGQRSESDPVTSDDFILIGVMTTWANLDTRAAAISNTWGRDVTGRLVFYVGHAGKDVTGAVGRNRTAGDLMK
ncbi:hypothetical protein ACOMHN_049404 [Nucella lapillus]